MLLLWILLVGLSSRNFCHSLFVIVTCPWDGAEVDSFQAPHSDGVNWRYSVSCTSSPLRTNSAAPSSGLVMPHTPYTSIPAPRHASLVAVASGTTRHSSVQCPSCLQCVLIGTYRGHSHRHIAGLNIASLGPSCPYLTIISIASPAVNVIRNAIPRSHPLWYIRLAATDCCTYINNMRVFQLP
jgi:hypothetical protein